MLRCEVLPWEPAVHCWPFVIQTYFFIFFVRFSDKITFISDVSPPINVSWTKAIIDRSDDACLASYCYTDSDLTDIGGEIEEMEESNSDISDGSVEESDYDQGDANTAIGRANCTV